MTVTREGSRLVPLKAMPTSRPTPLAYTAIDISPVITFHVFDGCDCIESFHFLANRSRTSISSSKYTSISGNFFKKYVCDSCGAVGLKSG